jgi:signal transduction histidine kinase
MKLRVFLKDRWLYVLAFLLASALAALLLHYLGAGLYAAVYAAFLFLLGGTAALVADYLRRRSFYRNLAKSLAKLEKKHLISEMLEEPSFAEGKILCNVLAQAGKSMNDEIAKYRIETKEYREYVETWVHEIKTPISACRLTLENNPGELASNLQADFDRIEFYVEQALFYARSGSLEHDYVLKQCTLKQIVSAAVKKNASLLIANGVKIKTDSLDLPVMTDAKWMEFILTQLLNNSVKYRRKDPVVRFSGIGRKNSVTLTVTDNGIGIPQKDLPRIFDKGFTGDNGRLTSAKSTGLGLYLCKQLCDKMGLSISVDSEEGSGTVISIVFPVSSMYSH